MDKPSARNTRRRQDGDSAGEKQRELQREQDRKDESAAKGQQQGGSKDQAVQAGMRDEPAPPMPAQHMPKPGIEAQMELKPEFLAPDYRGSGKIEGMTALVTGGDSGIGRAVAVLCAREGADVAIVYLNSHEDAQKTRRQVQNEGRQCLVIAGEVQDSGFCSKAAQDVVAKFGKLDVLVNNAAFQLHAQDLEDITDERLEETMKTNIFGYFYMARAALPHLKKGSCIINTGSVTGLQGSSHLLDYSAIKGAIPCLHHIAGQQPDRQGHPGQRGAEVSRGRPGNPGGSPVG